MSNLGEEIYSGTADFGKAMSLISAVIGTIISIGLIIGGIYLITKKNVYTGKTSGKVIEAHCSEQNNITTCHIRVSYTVDNKEYIISKDTNNWINLGDTVDVEYNPLDPSNAEVQHMNPRLAGIILLSIAVFLLVAGWLSVYLTRRYKAFAAISGVSSGINLLRR
jgi:hypothetical protein